MMMIDPETKGIQERIQC